MTLTVTPHLNFRGNARAALEFYQSVFGGSLAAVSYADAHAVQNPDEADQIMFGQVVSDDGFRIMAYDVPSSTAWSPGEIPVFVSVRGRDADQITRSWERLAEDATIVTPLAPGAWTPLYGMLRDRFGVTWVLDVEVDGPGA